MFLSIPEGVSVMTVISDGVDVAPGSGETFIRHPGAKGKALGHYDPMRLKWLNNPGGKPQTPCDPGLCKIFPEAKTAAKAWARASANRRTTTTGISASVCVHATLRHLPAPETALPFSPRAKLCPMLIEN